MNRFTLTSLGTLLLVLGLVNLTIFEREALQKEGTSILLRLAPVDPRSLMQGDYMALNFAVSAQVPNRKDPATPTDGYVVIKRSPNGVGEFQRLYRKGEALAADEYRIRYRLRADRVRIVTNAYFFQEGTATAYEKAQYGDLHVAANGDALLVGLRDAALQPLGVGAGVAAGMATGVMK